MIKDFAIKILIRKFQIWNICGILIEIPKNLSRLMQRVNYFYKLFCQFIPILFKNTYLASRIYAYYFLFYLNTKCKQKISYRNFEGWYVFRTKKRANLTNKYFEWIKTNIIRIHSLKRHTKKKFYKNNLSYKSNSQRLGFAFLSKN